MVGRMMQQQREDTRSERSGAENSRPQERSRVFVELSSKVSDRLTVKIPSSLLFLAVIAHSQVSYLTPAGSPTVPT